MINLGDSGNRSTRRWISMAGGLALLVAIFVQWRSISQLRHENESLRAQLQAAPPEASDQPDESPAAEVIDRENALAARRQQRP